MLLKELQVRQTCLISIRLDRRLQAICFHTDSKISCARIKISPRTHSMKITCMLKLQTAKTM